MNLFTLKKIYRSRIKFCIWYNIKNIYIYFASYKNVEKRCLKNKHFKFKNNAKQYVILWTKFENFYLNYLFYI